MVTTQPEVGSGSKTQTASTGVKTTGNAAHGLRQLFQDEIKDIYWAEQALVKAIPDMIKNATAPDLIKGLTDHLEVTKIHVTRLEKVFSAMNMKPEAKKCEAMAGLIKEGSEIMAHTEKGVVRDAGIILAAQKVEHYEIATYGTLAVFAQTLGENSLASLLDETLSEEKEADMSLTKVAQKINVKAATADN